MEKHEFDTGEHQANDIPHSYLAHQRQIAVEKATDAIIKAEQRESICDRINDLFQDVERGQTYPINTFK